MSKERNKAIPASYLVLRDGEKVLLMRRFNTGYCDGQYSLPAGHVEVREAPLECLIREASEEIDIVVKKEDVGFVHTMYRPLEDEANQRVDFFFEVSKWSGTIINKEPQKCDEVSWHPIDKLPKNTIPYVAAALKATFGRNSYSEHGIEDKK